MRALLSIDYTFDFVADEGRLTTGAAGQAIEAALVARTQAFIEAGEYVVFAIDRHEETDNYHPENRLFPPHNLAGSAGRHLYGRLAPLYENIRKRQMSIGSTSVITPRLAVPTWTSVCGKEGLRNCT